jgi:hypothetical protein
MESVLWSHTRKRTPRRCRTTVPKHRVSRIGFLMASLSHQLPRRMQEGSRDVNPKEPCGKRHRLGRMDGRSPASAPYRGIALPLKRSSANFLWGISFIPWICLAMKGGIIVSYGPAALTRRRVTVHGRAIQRHGLIHVRVPNRKFHSSSGESLFPQRITSLELLRDWLADGLLILSSGTRCQPGAHTFSDVLWVH